MLQIAITKILETSFKNKVSEKNKGIKNWKNTITEI